MPGGLSEQHRLYSNVKSDVLEGCEGAIVFGHVKVVVTVTGHIIRPMKVIDCKCRPWLWRGVYLILRKMTVMMSYS